MKAEIYLSRGEREGMFRAELYLDRYRPANARIAEISQEKIITLVVNFYNGLVFGGVETELSIDVKNKGIEDKLFREINEQVQKKLEELNIRRNMN